jgi:DNA polymerase III alpha subunit
VKLPDIDIDTAMDFIPEEVFPDSVHASRVLNGGLVRHPCGVYFQNIPRDKVTGLSAIPFREAEDLGYTKIDLLHLSVYDHFQSKKEIEQLLKLEPDWELLSDKEAVSKLFQLSRDIHWDTIQKIKPRDINRLADTLALIRPGKKALLDRYLRREVSQKELYRRDDKGYTFKKSHAIAYAHVIKLQLHLIKGGIL